MVLNFGAREGMWVGIHLSCGHFVAKSALNRLEKLNIALEVELFFPAFSILKIAVRQKKEG